MKKHVPFIIVFIMNIISITLPWLSTTWILNGGKHLVISVIGYDILVGRIAIVLFVLILLLYVFRYRMFVFFVGLLMFTNAAIFYFSGPHGVQSEKIKALIAPGDFAIGFYVYVLSSIVFLILPSLVYLRERSLNKTLSFYCSSCNTEVEKNDELCPKCGVNLNE